VSVPPAARLAPASEPSGVRASMVEGAAVVINGPHPLVPIERCQRVNSPWMRGREHLSAPAHQEQMQGVRGGEHLPAPAHQEQMQGVRGASICQHQRIRSKCKECGGASICPHQRQRSRCKECGGASICQHQRIRSRCKECREEADTSMPAGLEELAGPAHAAGKDL
jgi:hypothetical protein